MKNTKILSLERVKRVDGRGKGKDGDGRFVLGKRRRDTQRWRPANEGKVFVNGCR